MKITELDPFIWLEDRNGLAATAWAQAESDLSRKIFTDDTRFAKTYDHLHEIFHSKEKLLAIKLVGNEVFNTFQDETHLRGIWRRTSVEEYLKPEPNWEILIDVDQLGATENEPWVLKDFETSPTTDRCLVYLSKHGQDAAEIREFSLTSKTFIEDGFFFPESKSDLTWLNDDQVLVSPALNEEDKTRSGYPRKCYAWKRGESFAEAKLIFEGPDSDVFLAAAVYSDEGTRTAILMRFVNDEHIEKYLLTDEEALPLSIALDAWPEGLRDGHVFFVNRSEWRGFKSGSLLSVPIDELVKPEVPYENIRVIFEPEAYTSFQFLKMNRKGIYLGISESIKTKVYRLKFEGETVQRSPIFAASKSSFGIFASDSSSPHIFFSEEDFLLPPTIHWVGEKEQKVIRSGKNYFNSKGLTSSQHWIRSKDGVEIPYTLLQSEITNLGSNTPTLLYGYGGFNDAVLPEYNPQVGKAWLEAGGAYVVANIRGGGEFGPEWHKAARLENKQRSYDDFIAIAEDLIAKKITSPRRLGICGRSNGGLLVGAVVMQRPELFNAVVCGVPLLDMLRYSMLPPGSSWMDEYGDPDDPKMRGVISKYSPYQNVHADIKYPKILFHTAEADDRVHPGHARKMAARMKELGHDVLFYESKDGGHAGGGVSLKAQARTAAYVYTYLYQQLMD